MYVCIYVCTITVYKPRKTFKVDEHVVRLDVSVQSELSVHERQSHQHLLTYIRNERLQPGKDNYHVQYFKKTHTEISLYYLYANVNVICMYVCKYSCMYVCKYLRIHVCSMYCMYVCMYVCVLSAKIQV